MLKETKENRRFCHLQISRLKGLKFFSTNIPEAVTELEAALFKAAACQAQGQLIIDTIVENEFDFPQPARIYLLARQFNDAITNALPSPCDLCREFNGRILVTGQHRGVEVSGLGFCQCPRGRALSASFEKYKAEEPVRELERAATPEEAAVLTEIFPAVPKPPVH